MKGMTGAGVRHRSSTSKCSRAVFRMGLALRHNRATFWARTDETLSWYA
jgi:hypothetical protein